jgi:hypothetical protein
MSIFGATVPPFIIPLGDSESNELDWKGVMQDAEGLCVIAPADLAADTFTWEVSHDLGVTWATLNDLTNTAVEVPDEGCAIIYNGVFSGIDRLRIKASGNVAADRTFTLRKIWRGL